MPEILIYTDGACNPNPGSGGWAAVLLSEDAEPKTLQGAEPDTTNNRMELTAPIKALQSLHEGCLVTVCTDSTYVRDGVTKWLNNWQQNGWETIDGNPVKNKDLWQALALEIARLDVSWRWVKGHGEDQWNNLVDQLAVEARGKQPAPVINDGSINMFLGVTCKHSTKTGGWAAVLAYKGHYKVLAEGMEDVTANTLYLEAVINGLEALKKPLPVTIYTSSGYLKEGATSWLPGWKRRNWQTRDGMEVANKEYWQKVDDYQGKYDLQFQLVDKANAPCHMQEAKEIAKEYELQVDQE